jgi:putative nucleotidyltransferase with HDIG domain
MNAHAQPSSWEPGAEPRVSSPLGRAAHVSATALRAAARTRRAAIYVRHPDGGYVLWAADRVDSGDEVAPPIRVWWEEEEGGAMWGGDGVYRYIPLGAEGLAVVGPLRSGRMGPLRSRSVRLAARDVAERLERAAEEERRWGAREQQAADEAAAALAAGDVDDLRDLLLLAIKLELSADSASLEGDRVVVRGAVRSSSIAVEILEGALRELASGAEDDSQARRRVLTALAGAVDARARHTIGHSTRVAQTAGEIASVLDCDADTRRTVELAGQLHDVGHLFCGAQPLSKIKLDDVERSIVQRHPQIGAAVASGAGLPEEVTAAIRGHHERWDGLGYPDASWGNRISLPARIIAVAEVFDTLMSPRPWRDSRDRGDALAAILEGAGTQFDPRVVQGFLDLQRTKR